jgi:hypothetical protein
MRTSLLLIRQWARRKPRLGRNSLKRTQATKARVRRAPFWA